MYFTIDIHTLVEAENQSDAWSKVIEKTKSKVALPNEPVEGFKLVEGYPFENAAKEFFDNHQKQTLGDVERSTGGITPPVPTPPAVPPISPVSSIPPIPSVPPVPSVPNVPAVPNLPPVPSIPAMPPMPKQESSLPNLPTVPEPQEVSVDYKSQIKCFGNYDNTDSICLNCHVGKHCSDEVKKNG